MLTRFVWAAAVFGIVAAWIVPGVSRVLRQVLPAQFAQYLPSDVMPTDIMSGLINATVYGVILSISLWLLAQVGIKASVPKVG